MITDRDKCGTMEVQQFHTQPENRAIRSPQCASALVFYCRRGASSPHCQEFTLVQARQLAKDAVVQADRQTGNS